MGTVSLLCPEYSPLWRQVESGMQVQWHRIHSWKLMLPNALLTLWEVQSTDISFRDLTTYDNHNQADRCLLLPPSLEEYSHVCLSCHRTTSIQLLRFSEWNWLQRNEWDINFFTLATYHSVMNFETNNWKQNREKIGLDKECLLFVIRFGFWDPRSYEPSQHVFACLYLPTAPGWSTLSEGNRLWMNEANFICLTDSWDCGKNPASELACALCTALCSLEFFKEKYQMRRKKKKFLGNVIWFWV